MALADNEREIFSRKGALGDSHLFMVLPGHVIEGAVVHGCTGQEDTPWQPSAL
ncbi:MAG: hypothetical protein M1399_00715 [Actinobacteria bacterium]|nr:hypothetical protein [Actinomycetota bacterium]